MARAARAHRNEDLSMGMRVRKLDENGDIVTRGEQWKYDKEAIAQNVSTRLKLFWVNTFETTQMESRGSTKMTDPKAFLARGTALRKSRQFCETGS